MIDMNVIRLSESPYSSPIVVVRKRHENNRICIEYRRLNRITLPDFEPMTSMPALTQKLGKSKYFSKLDLSKEYWQIAVKEDVDATPMIRAFENAIRNNEFLCYSGARHEEAFPGAGRS